MMLDELRNAETLDPAGVDLEGCQQVTYLLEQSFRYDYSSPVEQLRHRLVVVPPAQHGDQQLQERRLDVSVDGRAAARELRRDCSGNTVARLRVDRVENNVQFRIGALVQRVRAQGPVRLPVAALRDPRHLRPTRLTGADAQLTALAESLRGSSDDTELATQICDTVHSELQYEYGVTSIWTTAAEALAGGRGVCQDAAHIMLAVCHVLQLPARYVSGHLLGQGGTHAWVEVLVAHRDHAVALPLDPCNGVPASARYLTIATGRDYADVPPTSGTFIGTDGGRLSTQRRVGVLAAA